MPATATRRRTDCHAPAAAGFDPQAYRLAGCFDSGCPISNLELAEVRRQLSGDGYRLGNGSNCNCGHCGAAIRYSALLVRDDVREYIHVGEVCLDNRFQTLTKEEFKRLREAARLNRERANFEERIDALVEQHPHLQRLLNNDATVQGNSFLSDVRRKFVENGRLSDNQIAAVERVFNAEGQRNQWAAEKAARQANWAAEKAALQAAGVQAPEGRVAVEGEIVSIKYQQNQFGPRRFYGNGASGYDGGNYKIVVKTAEGWSVYVTLPSNLADQADAAKGRRIKFTATLTRSDRDVTFAFGKRPTGAQFLNS
jgi:hypothetical protein